MVVCCSNDGRREGFRRGRESEVFSGWYWCRTTGSMVPFESVLEREAVVVFDFDPSVVEIVVQPFALLWPLLQDGAG
jgi:hypothetical protein